MSIEILPDGTPVVTENSTNSSLTAAESAKLAKANIPIVGTPQLTEEQKSQFVEAVTHMNPVSSTIMNHELTAFTPDESTETTPAHELINPMTSSVTRTESSHDSKMEILNRMNAIIDEFNGISNIPLTHEYWDLIKQYRSIK